eukprot:Nitzschia sp. Nitz4//scaffold76_size158648//47065//48882//NITZ4_002538-RA/size158648-processed-gene-0.234-mRNA-1//1//CDS//3329557821//268//frame0
MSPPNPNAAKGVAGLNVYKKLAIIRKADDVLTYEEADGAVKTISDLHLAAAATTPMQKPRAKHDIPVPKIKNVETYNKDIPPNYDCPIAYVRNQKPSRQMLSEMLEYVVDAEDEVWLHNNSKFGGSILKPQVPAANATPSSDPAEAKKRKTEAARKATVRLPLDMLEVMMDVLEKATAFDTIITMDQAETLILQRLPQLYHMYPMKASSGVVTMKIVLTDVYNYWVSKRSKLKRPLLRRFWPVTATDDTNPHLVFRPREKEKYKLRKKRQNDLEAYRKMEQLKQDFAHVRVLCSLVRQREELFRTLVLLQREQFRQRFYDAVDTSGLPRVSQELDKEKVKSELTVDKHFETQEGWNRKKRRGSQTGRASRSSTPVPSSGVTGGFGMDMIGASAAGGGGAGDSARHPVIVAGQNHGEPAPNFLHPLHTREGYTTSWDGVSPPVSSFVDGRPLSTYRFRHRPRVGRGGRVCIDRVPLAEQPDVTIPTFYRAGHPTISSGPQRKHLMDLIPPPLDRERLRQRMEAISLDALKDDYDLPRKRPPAGADPDEEDGDVVIVKMDDWLNTDDQPWGEERYAVGPL